MKHVYPVRHPASLDTPPKGSTTSTRDQAREPSLAHEQDESSGSQASGTAQQRKLGRQAHDDAAGPGSDTDKGPVMDQVYNQAVAPGRGRDGPRR